MKATIESLQTTGNRVFYAQCMEIAEIELMAEGLPITQDGANQLATKRWKGSRIDRRRRQLDGCYGRNTNP